MTASISLLTLRSWGQRSRSHCHFEFHLDRHTRFPDANSKNVIHAFHETVYMTAKWPSQETCWFSGHKVKGQSQIIAFKFFGFRTVIKKCMCIFVTECCAHLLHDIIKNPIDFQDARSKVNLTGSHWSLVVPSNILSVWWLKKAVHIFYRNGVHGLWMIFQRTLLFIRLWGQRSRSCWKGRLEVHLRCYLCVPDGIWMKSCNRPKEIRKKPIDHPVTRRKVKVTQSLWISSGLSHAGFGW